MSDDDIIELDITGLASQGWGTSEGSVSRSGMMHDPFQRFMNEMAGLSALRGLHLPFPFMGGLGGSTGVTPLHIACDSGNEETVRYLVNFGNLDINAIDAFGLTPLMCAAKKGHTAIVKFLVSQKECSVDKASASGLTALYHATNGGHNDVVKVLLQDGHCNTTIKNENGTIPLHIAARKGFEIIVKLLAGGGTNQCDNKGLTALHFACKVGHLAIVKLLTVQKGCNPNVQDIENHHTPLQYAVIEGHVHVVRFLCKLENIDAEAVDKNGHNCVFNACKHGYPEIVRFLVEKSNCNYMLADSKGIVPLHIAAKMGHVTIVECLSQYPIERKSKSGKTALHYACQQGKLPVVKCLIEKCKSCNKNCIDEQSKTPLHLAAEKGYFEIVKYLCSNEVDCSDPNMKDSNGRMPLHYAADHGHINTAKYLVEKHQSDPTIPDENGSTPLVLALKRGHFDLVDFFKKHTSLPTPETVKPKPPGSTSSSDCNPFLLVKNDDLKKLKEVVSKKGKNFIVNLQGKHGDTILHKAAFYGHIRVVQYLVEQCGCDISSTSKKAQTYGSTKWT